MDLPKSVAAQKATTIITVVRDNKIFDPHELDFPPAGKLPGK